MRTAVSVPCWALNRAAGAAQSRAMPSASMPMYNTHVVLMSRSSLPSIPFGDLHRDQWPVVERRLAQERCPRGELSPTKQRGDGHDGAFHRGVPNLDLEGIVR